MSIDTIWSDLLTFINQLVSPDWGALIALVPILLVLLVGLYLAWLLVRFTGAGPTRRGKQRLEPRPPPGVHAAEASWAPVLAAVGCVGLMFGLVFSGWVLAVGVTLLILSLVFWLREGMRDYDHVEHSESGVVPIPSSEPPPGVHVPGPSFRPILASIAMAVLLYGLVFGGWLLLAGVVMFAIALLQWLVDARREYRGVVVADVTGHLPPDPRPGYPRATLATFAILVVGALVLQTGLLPPQAASGGSPGGSAPPPSGAPSSAPSGSGEPAGETADVTVVAVNIAFVGGADAEHIAPADAPFTIKLQNDDAGIPHNVAIREGGASGPELWKGAIFPGVETRIYDVTPLPAGTYTFICDVHPTMIGTLVVK